LQHHITKSLSAQHLSGWMLQMPAAGR